MKRETENYLAVTAVLRCAQRDLCLQSPQVMGILNITPDSFSDGGQLYRDGRADVNAALGRAREMLEEGATILDVGGESTRPGARAVSSQEEMDRVLPVVQALCDEFPAVVSVDTSTPALMREAAALGAGMINDVRALRRPGALQAVSESAVAVCLMHMRGEPGTMQKAPHYEDLLSEIRDFLMRRVTACLEAGIAAHRLILDPGFGFGKTPEHNLRIIERLKALQINDLPLLVGVSRKSTLSHVLGEHVEGSHTLDTHTLENSGQRLLAGGLALSVLAVLQGARIVRTHDVAPTVAALRVVHRVHS